MVAKQIFFYIKTKIHSSLDAKYYVQGNIKPKYNLYNKPWWLHHRVRVDRKMHGAKFRVTLREHVRLKRGLKLGWRFILQQHYQQKKVAVA